MVFSTTLMIGDDALNSMLVEQPFFAQPIWRQHVSEKLP